ncbi:MAG: peptide deformylase [Eubacteriales bacterium]|jgi:peptide deformylase|nr:peptide deformylase [Eubacteriales bacterium]
MAILKIITDDNPLLRKVSRPVDKITPRICRLLDDMRDTLTEVSGIGLAAPQVGVLRRIAIVENEQGETLELINPRIIARSAEVQNELEGCLSIPDKWGITERPESVTVETLDRGGNKIIITESRLTARALCHEIDHLDGILFTDNVQRILTTEEVRELREEEE